MSSPCSGRMLLNLADGPGEGHHLDMSRAALSEGARGGGGGRAAGVDVVDEDDARGSDADRAKRAADVAAALGERQSTLLRHGPGSREQTLDRELPPAAELPCQALGGMVPALAAAVAVRRHEGEHRGVGARHRLREDLACDRGEPAEAAVLPGADDGAHRIVVRHRGPCAREGEPAARALPAPGDGPGGRGPAARAQRRRQTRKCIETRSAELTVRRPPADDTTRREEQFDEEAHTPATLPANL